MANYGNLEAALPVQFKQARSHVALLSGPLLMEKNDVFDGQMGLEFSANPGCIERFKKRHAIVFKIICMKSREVSKEMASGWLESTLLALSLYVHLRLF
jgi:hypothetical protein